MENERFDVIVIGGGPSGLHNAAFLADYGLNVVLLEQDSHIGEGVVCSGVISNEAFSRFDLPSESIVGKLKQAEIFSPSGICIPYQHPTEAAVVVDRHIFDAKLGETARKNGARIWLNTKVVSLSANDKFVEALIINEEGEKKIRAEVAVIATGVSFKLQTSLGMGRPKRIIKGIQVDVKTKQVKNLKIYFGNGSSKGFFGWAIPLFDGRTRIGVMTTGDAVSGLKNTLHKVNPDIDSESEANKAGRRGIAFGTIQKTYSNRIIAIGEAAGQIKTTTGGGIYYGLITAHIAAEVIRNAFKKKCFDEKILSEYEKMWKKSLNGEIKFGQYFHRFYSNLDDKYIDKLFSAAKEDGLLSFIAEKGKFDWHKNAVIKILRSPNLRGVLFNGLIKQVMN